MKKITSKKMLNYGAMSAALLGAANAAGQVVYTDVDPDETITTATAGGFNIDLNADGTFDFNPQVFDAANGPGAVIFPTGSGSNSNQGSNGNGFVGFNAGNFAYPSNLGSGDAIDGNASFVTDARGDLNFYSCAYTNSQFCGGVTDRFLGVSFQLAGNTHYGWIRLDLAPSGDNFVIKDFAYNATPGAAIAAGDQGTLGIDDNVFTSFEYFVDSSNNLNLKAASSMDNVILHNTLGQQVLSQKLSSSNELVNLNALKSGVYLATVSIEGKAKSFKIVKK